MEARNLDVLETISKKYGIEVKELEKIKNAYKITTDEGVYCFKIIKYNYGHFLFLFNAMKHLQKNGFETVPEFILTKEGKDFVWIDNNRAYLTPWVIAREANYDNPIDIEIASRKLADLHVKSRGFEVTDEMNPRVGWLRWVEIFKTRKDEILDFKRRIEAKGSKSEFDQLYISYMDEELDRATKAIDNLINSNYFDVMMQQVSKMGFCHHDYAHHNVLIGKENLVNIIDFDYCILDTYLHDLCSLLIRRMKDGKWSIENAEEIIMYYNEVNPIAQRDIPIMAGFMEFPQAYWQLGIQYYWEEQPWGEEFFIKKLEKIHEDREYRQEFIEEFRSKKWGMIR